MYVAALALLLLAAAVVLLFAMMGELASRLPGQEGEVAGRLAPIAGYREDVTAGDWPAELAPLSHEPATALLVLSPICTTCGKVAASLTSRTLDPPVGLVISAHDRSSGEEFIATHTLETFPYFIDDGGVWTSSKVGINQSPTALLFNDGKITGVYSFSDVTSVMQMLDHKVTEDAT
jgi:hypothetical protein